MASQSTGIQQLLTAEKRAAEKVAEARKRKARRLKQAKEEAQAEIEAYRQERERAFREFEAKSMGTKGDMEAKIAENTTRKIQDIHVSVNRQKEPALNKLLQLVYDIKPELHQNMSV